MTPQPLSLQIVGGDLVKKVSTSGVQYVLSKVRNSLLSVPPQSSEGTLVLSLENLTELIATFRCRSSEEGIQAQIQLGPNSIQLVYLPYAEDYLLSTDQDLKVSEVSFLQHHFPSTKFESFLSPNPSIQVTSSGNLSLTPERLYSTSGYSNIFFKQSLGKGDFIRLSVVGKDVVTKLGDLRLRFVDSGYIILPASKLLKTISLGSSSPFKFLVGLETRKYEKPGYVPPEAAIWSFENTAN